MMPVQLLQPKWNQVLFSIATSFGTRRRQSVSFRRTFFSTLFSSVSERSALRKVRRSSSKKPLVIC